MTGSDLKTLLFVPASRPERIPKAIASGAGAVIVDLEDAVPAEAKDSARQALDSFLAGHDGAPIYVRINARGQPGLRRTWRCAPVMTRWWASCCQKPNPPVRSGRWPVPARPSFH